MWTEWLRERGTDAICPFNREEHSVVLGLTLVSTFLSCRDERKIVGEFWYEGFQTRLWLFEEEEKGCDPLADASNYGEPWRVTPAEFYDDGMTRIWPDPLKRCQAIGQCYRDTDAVRIVADRNALCGIDAAEARDAWCVIRLLQQGTLRYCGEEWMLWGPSGEKCLGREFPSCETILTEAERLDCSLADNRQIYPGELDKRKEQR